MTEQPIRVDYVIFASTVPLVRICGVYTEEPREITDLMTYSPRQLITETEGEPPQAMLFR